MTRLVDDFKVLSVEARLKIVQLLQDGKPLCVNALASRLAMTPSAISQHLRILKGAGWVSSRKRGYWVHYSLKPRKLERLRRELDAFVGKSGKGKVPTRKTVKRKRR